VIAAIGAAIGVGNLWRFPYLVYKWGGAIFFIPYLLCLFLLGLPMMMLEFSLGQVLQKGNIAVWEKLHPRLQGIGLASTLASYLITFYYNVIIAWALVYLCASFINPLPWSVQNTLNENKTSGKCDSLHITEEFFYKDILHVYDDECVKYNSATTMGEGTEFQWQVWLAQMVVWFICFICVFKGVELSSKIVWITVPLPLVFVFIMVMNALTLPNSDYGYRMYLKGEENGIAPDIVENLSDAGMWSEACAQIFFSLGVCMGIMVSYASHNPVDVDIVKNGFTVAGCNSSFSFLAGFSVFGTVGYLNGLNSQVATKTSSIGLAFIAYPAAIETLPGANFWTFLLATTLFALGIDSAFAIVEATCTVIKDTTWGSRFSKPAMSGILCGFGAICSTVFCFNWGFTYFDIVDHYLNVYLILLMGIFQSVACGWVHCFEDSYAHSKASTLILIVGYWTMLVPLAWLAYFAFPNDSWTAIPIFWGWFFLIALISMLVGMFVSKLSFKTWYYEVFFYGVKPISEHMCGLAKPALKPVVKVIFEYWWCFSIKFVFPWAIWWLIIMTIKKDTTQLYEGYNIGW
jgi:SNF family Na+-dependent transporter